MAETLRFGLPMIAADQAQKHVTHNTALEWLEPLAAGIAASATSPAPPASPAEGELHIVPPAGWPGVADGGDLAQWRAGAWSIVEPPAGLRLVVADEGGARVFAGRDLMGDGPGWVRGSVFGAVTGAGLGLAVADAFLDLSGASVTAAGLIPSRVIVLGVTTWTAETVTGATGYRCGTSVGGSEFGGSLGVAVGANNVGVVGPFATYSPADVVISAEGGSFTGGRVGVAVSMIAPGGAPL